MDEAAVLRAQALHKQRESLAMNERREGWTERGVWRHLYHGGLVLGFSFERCHRRVAVHLRASKSRGFTQSRWAGARTSMSRSSSATASALELCTRVRRTASAAPRCNLLSEVVAAPRKVAAVPLKHTDLLRDVTAHDGVYVYGLGHAIRK